jgi:light-regulated signal transduction histidine kinase (bacteriophytochrome)
MRQVHLVQLFQNLISNSIKYRKQEPPRIHISAGPHQGDSWLFSVKDNGIGIEPEYQQQVFGIFRRLHGHEQYPGTGIGLAICRRIVEQHGGRIWVDSKAGEGATFLFTLPASPSKKFQLRVTRFEA